MRRVGTSEHRVIPFKLMKGVGVVVKIPLKSQEGDKGNPLKYLKKRKKKEPYSSSPSTKKKKKSYGLMGE